jgi:hypothetical protein
MTLDMTGPSASNHGPSDPNAESLVLPVGQPEYIHGPSGYAYAEPVGAQNTPKSLYTATTTSPYI